MTPIQNLKKRRFRFRISNLVRKRTGLANSCILLTEREFLNFNAFASRGTKGNVLNGCKILS